tara:strand:+ start:628 stop:2163 length:1536 start_codon:yes stop_codon:yes gene_type:complete
MTSPWLSESGSSSAKLVILLGAIEKEVLLKEIDLFPAGVLWIGSGVVSDDFSFPNLRKINSRDELDKISESLYEFFALDYNEMPMVKVSNMNQETDCEFHLKTLKFISEKIDSVSRARRTRSSTGMQRQEQIFKNLPGYLLSRIPNEWSTLASRSVAVVVGAGPSLDYTLPLLRTGLVKPVIIAADSSLRALNKLGIKPDFVVSIDPNKDFANCSTPDFCPGIVILSSQSHPSWRDAWKDKVRFSSGRVLTEDWLAENGIGKTPFTAKSNSGLTALSFADFLNPAVVIMVGMDLSGGKGGAQRYAKSTGRAHIEIHASNIHKVPGNYETEVLTPFFSDWSETSSETFNISKRRLVLNFNDRGAQLQGCTLIHPDEVDEMKKAVNESILPFKTEVSLLSKKRKVDGVGMEQILTLLTNHCDRIWNEFPHDPEIENSMKYLKSLLADRDTAKLVGDFAFVIMPFLHSDQKFPQDQLIKTIIYLKKIVWLLEDSILECSDSEEFLIRFLTGQNN